MKLPSSCALIVFLCTILFLPVAGESVNVKLTLQQSEDLNAWTDIAITAAMLSQDGCIELDGLPDTAFFRLALEGFPTPPVPDSMVLVEGGTLSTSNALDGTEVDTFHIGRYEVTWGEWKDVRTWAAANGYDIGAVGNGCADDHPVHSVSYYDTLKWCNAKSEMEGLTPVYLMTGGIVYRTMQPALTSISRNVSSNGYRLPSEREWEFAARGGNQGQGHSYAGSADMSAVGWYAVNSGGAACPLSSGRGTWPVGQKAANELGLFDMSGNVSEWCWGYSEELGTGRPLRGGNWDSQAQSCAVSNRSSGLPTAPMTNGGFRVARSVQTMPMVLVENGTLSSSNALNGTTLGSFYMGRYTVTWGEWKAVRTWAAANGYDIGDIGNGCTDDHPAHSLNWFDAMKWCNAKSEIEGLTPVYSMGENIYKTGIGITIGQNLAANGYRLPLEAEWEFAARGGNHSNGYTYAGSDNLDAVGWFTENSAGALCGNVEDFQDRGTWPVGRKAPNEIGLYDMSGNLFEWCWETTGTNRRTRGGGFAASANFCALSSRPETSPASRGPGVGLRLVRSSGE